MRDFSVVMEEHRARLTSHARRIAPAGYEAEDLVQDTLIRAWRSRRRYRTSRPFMNWALRIMERLVLDHLRNESRRATGHCVSLEATLGGSLADAACDLAIERVERRIAVRQELAARAPLAAQQLAVLEACDGAGLDYAEAARAMGVPAGTVRSRLHRARGRVRQALWAAL